MLNNEVVKNACVIRVISADCKFIVSLDHKSFICGSARLVSSRRYNQHEPIIIVIRVSLLSGGIKYEFLFINL